MRQRMRRIYAKKQQKIIGACAKKKSKKNQGRPDFKPGTFHPLRRRLSHSATLPSYYKRQKNKTYISNKFHRMRKFAQKTCIFCKPVACAKIALNTFIFFVNPPHASMYILRISKKNNHGFFQKLLFFLRKSAAYVDACVGFAQIIFLRNCAYCAKFGADLQPCALKNHYFAPHIKGVRRLGTQCSTE